MVNVVWPMNPYFFLYVAHNQKRLPTPALDGLKKPRVLYGGSSIVAMVITLIDSKLDRPPLTRLIKFSFSCVQAVWSSLLLYIVMRGLTLSSVELLLMQTLFTLQAVLLLPHGKGRAGTGSLS